MFSFLWNRLATLIRPDELLLQPTIDFDARTGTLKILVASDLNGKIVNISRRSLIKGRGVFRGRRFRINPHGLEVIQRILPICEWTDEVTLCCKQGSVPSCLATLRTWFNIGQTPAAKAVKIFTTPLENRTYLDLDDPETLVVRQTLHNLR